MDIEKLKKLLKHEGSSHPLKCDTDPDLMDCLRTLDHRLLHAGVAAYHINGDFVQYNPKYREFFNREIDFILKVLELLQNDSKTGVFEKLIYDRCMFFIKDMGISSYRRPKWNPFFWRPSIKL